MPAIVALRHRSRLRFGRIVIEMVLAMPIVLSLAMGAAEYGYLIFVKGVLQDAAWAGARAAILDNASNNSVASAVGAVMQAQGLGSSGYTVATNPASVSAVYTSYPITVTVSCNWGSVGIHALPTSMGGIPNSKDVSAVATMVRE